MMRPLPSLSQAYNVLLQEEKQRGLSYVSYIVSHTAAFNAQNTLGTKFRSHMEPALAGQQQRKAYNPS